MPKTPATIVAVKALLLHRGKALLVKRSASDLRAPGLWEFAGGKLEFGETPAQALAREVQEETGLTVQPGPVLYAESFMASPSLHVVVNCFLCRSASNAVTLSFEHDDYRWVTQSQLLALAGGGLQENLAKNAIFQRPDVDILP